MTLRLLVAVSIALTTGCGLGDDDCTIYTSLASTTEASSGAIPEDWASAGCTPEETEICHDDVEGSFMLCQHDNVLVQTGDAGVSYLGLKCASYRSSDSACRSSDDDSKHHHHIDTGGLYIPNG